MFGFLRKWTKPIKTSSSSADALDIISSQGRETDALEASASFGALAPDCEDEAPENLMAPEVSACRTHTALSINGFTEGMKAIEAVVASRIDRWQLTDSPFFADLIRAQVQPFEGGSRAP